MPSSRSPGRRSCGVRARVTRWRGSCGACRSGRLTSTGATASPTTCPRSRTTSCCRSRRSRSASPRSRRCCSRTSSRRSRCPRRSTASCRRRSTATSSASSSARATTRRCCSRSRCSRCSGRRPAGSASSSAACRACSTSRATTSSSAVSATSRWAALVAIAVILASTSISVVTNLSYELRPGAGFPGPMILVFNGLGSMFVFAVIYRYAPLTRMRWRSALLGGIPGGLAIQTVPGDRRALRVGRRGVRGRAGLPAARDRPARPVHRRAAVARRRGHRRARRAAGTHAACRLSSPGGPSRRVVAGNPGRPVRSPARQDCGLRPSTMRVGPLTAARARS